MDCSSWKTLWNMDDLGVPPWLRKPRYGRFIANLTHPTLKFTGRPGTNPPLGPRSRTFSPVLAVDRWPSLGSSEVVEDVIGGSTVEHDKDLEVSWNSGTPKSSIVMGIFLNVGRWLVFWVLIATSFPKIIQHPLIAKPGRKCNKFFLGCDFFSELFIC